MKSFNKISITPNPFTLYAIITIPNYMTIPCSMEIMNQKGNMLKKFSNIHSKKFILGREHLKPGKYYFKLYGNDIKNYQSGELIIKS